MGGAGKNSSTGAIVTTDAELNELCALLPTLPDREPWLDLKFHAWEVLRYSREILELLPAVKRLLEAGTQPKALCEGLSRIDFLLMYPVVRGVRLVIELAGQPQAHPPASAPQLPRDCVDQAFAPSEVRDCRSRGMTREKMALHLEALGPVVLQAHEAVVRALSAQGSEEQVLEQMRSEFSSAQELFLGVAARHARAAYDWADQYWRLTDPDGREARFDRLRAMFRAGQASGLPAVDSARI
jgi:hypothetical protein